MENSKIEWTDHTFNPWIGCTKVSTGCKNCYAEALMDKRLSRAKWGPQGTRVRTTEQYWKKPLAWNRQAEKSGVRQRVFCASLADVFEDHPAQREEMDSWRRELFHLIVATPHLDWLLLTKRPELVNSTIERVTGFSEASMWFHTASVWIGTSVENQEQADQRIPKLLKVPATVRFLSMEPLLDFVDLTHVIYENIVQIDALRGLVGFPDPHEKFDDQSWPLDWVIVGGESGRHARPMHHEWVRSIRDQCYGAGVPFHFKQWGEYLYKSQLEGAGLGKFAKVEPYSTLWKVGKKMAGRKLDGQLYHNFPLVN